MPTKPKRNIVIKKKADVKPKKSVTTIPQKKESVAKNVEPKNVQESIEKQAQKIIGDVGGSVVSKPQ
jgi:hypothetical protein